jgi:carbamoyl-phosphate synthase large subunit
LNQFSGHIYDIIQHENQKALSFNWKTALKLAEKLSKYGIKIIGTSFDALI